MLIAILVSTRPLQGLTMSQLINCLQAGGNCDQAEAVAELSTRNEPDLLIAAYEQSDDGYQRAKLVEALSYLESSRVSVFMRSVSRPSPDREAFLANLYLARQGDEKALESLNRVGGYVSSSEWAAALHLFGKYRYRAAAGRLIDALGAASGNVTQAAEESLRILFPGAPVEFKTVEAAQRYFQERAAKLGMNKMP